MWSTASCPQPRLPIVPGHEIVGRVDALGAGVDGLRLGERVGVPWLGGTCGDCPYCLGAQENLCDHAAVHRLHARRRLRHAAIADARFAFPLGEQGSDEAPRRCCAPA